MKLKEKNYFVQNVPSKYLCLHSTGTIKRLGTKNIKNFHWGKILNEKCFIIQCEIQAHLGDIACLVPDHHNKASHKLFLSSFSCALEGLGFQFVKRQHLWSIVKQSTIKRRMPVAEWSLLRSSLNVLRIIYIAYMLFILKFSYAFSLVFLDLIFFLWLFLN